MFNKILSTMPGTVERIFFAGIGEPLFHPDIFEMIHLANQCGKQTGLLTNSTLIDDSVCMKIMESGLNELWFSIDTIDADTEEDYKGHRNDAALKVAFVDRKRKELKKSIDLAITLVITKSNYQTLSKVPEFIKMHNIKDVNISRLFPLEESSDADLVQDKIVKNFLNTNNSKARQCRFIEESCCFVRSDGDVSPCMGLLHSTKTFLHTDKRIAWHHSFGNIKEQSLTSIWQSTEFSSFRERVEKFSFSPCILCGGCDFRKENIEDCLGNTKPTCGGCLWSEGVISCP